MESKSEDGDYCELFFNLINEMVHKFMLDNGMIPKLFNPTNIQCDEHTSNRNGIEAVFGMEFLTNRTSSCEYHIDKSIKKHVKVVADVDKKSYEMLIISMKNATTKESYEGYKNSLKDLIERQNENVKKSLNDTLTFWDNINWRWATAFKSNLHNVHRSSLAEAAQASMKAANEKNVSLVDATYNDITDSARLDAKWKNRQCGERATGTGPTFSDLQERYDFLVFE